MIENLNHIIESLLFVSEEPLTVEKLKSILETAETKEIRSALESLVEAYEARGGGFKLAQVAGGWQLRSRAQYNHWIKRMLQPPPQRLSKAALETLAIVAYNQPIIRADIEHIRGVDCGGVLRQLLERKLIRVLGRKEIPGRPLIYATTKLFLELFELKDLKDLPSPKEIEEMTTAAEETSESHPATGKLPLFDDVERDPQLFEFGFEADNADPPVAKPTNPLSESMTEKPSAETGAAQPNCRSFTQIQSTTPKVPAGRSCMPSAKPKISGTGRVRINGSR